MITTLAYLLNKGELWVRKHGGDDFVLGEFNINLCIASSSSSVNYLQHINTLTYLEHADVRMAEFLGDVMERADVAVAAASDTPRMECKLALVGHAPVVLIHSVVERVDLGVGVRGIHGHLKISLKCIG